MPDQPACPPLVSPDWLYRHLGDPAVRIIDIRSAVDGGGRAAFVEAHIPGAVHTDYARDGWRATRGMATGLLPDPDLLSVVLGTLGLGPEQHAVVVSAGTSVGDFSAAARVYWTLKVAGHARVSVLDGGMRAWRHDPARPVENGEGAPRSPARYPVRFVAGLRADLAAVRQAVAEKSAVLLDSRSAAYFEGREKSPQALRAGRLPAAVHLDHARAYDAGEQQLRPKAELAALVARIPPGPVINYCNTGHQAATTWFVLSECLGRPDVSLYDGSMSEWTEAADRPVEAGATQD